MNETFQIEKISETSGGIDALEKFMLDEFEPAIEELEHVHTPGLYGRLWKAKAGSLWVTRVHKVRHQFVVLKGAISVWVDGKEIFYEAGYHGITEPGTRRVLYVYEDCEFMTFHPNPDNLNEDDMVSLVTEPHDNKLFSKEDEELLKSIRSEIKQRYLIQ